MFQKLAIGNQGLDGFFFTDGYAILGLVIDPAPQFKQRGPNVCSFRSSQRQTVVPLSP